MKILLFGNRKPRTRTPWYFFRALQALGHQVKWIRYKKLRSFIGEKAANLICQIRLLRFQPDLVFIHSKDISLSLLKWIWERFCVILYFDDPFEGNIVDFGRYTHLLFTTSQGDVESYRRCGIQAAYITGGCDPDFHKPYPNPPLEYVSDLAFIGRPNTEERVQWIQKLRQKFDLKLYGSGWEKWGIKVQKKHAYPEDYQKVCSGAKIILGQNAVVRDLYFSNRVWYTLGCRGFFLTFYTPRMEEIFERGVHLDWFHTQEECEEKIRYYLDHPEERERIRQAGYELAHREYSFQKVAERMLQTVRERLFSKK